MDGYVNIDVARSPLAPRDPDIFADAGDIPLEDDCADEIIALHVIEHFYRWDVDRILREWTRLLKPGGRLILELPNIYEVCRNYVRMAKDGRYGTKDMAQWAEWPLYGDPTHEDPFMCHRWGYDPHTIHALLEPHGFTSITIMDPQTHGKRAHRDMRVEAVLGS